MWNIYAIVKLKVDDLQTLDEFIQAFHDNDVYTRRRVVDLLGARANPDAIDFLITVLNDPEVEVRSRILYALADIRDERAIPALEVVAQNDKAEVSPGHKLNEIAEDMIAFIKRKQEDEAWS